MNNKDFYNKLWEESPMGRIGCGSPVVAVIVVAIVLMFSSCATKREIQYVDRDVVRYETKIQHDTLINNVHDSIRIEKKGDTVFVDRWHTRNKERIVVKTDTCYRDSIQTQIKETTVEKQKIPKWCYGSLVICLLFIIFAIVKLVRCIQIH